MTTATQSQIQSLTQPNYPIMSGADPLQRVAAWLSLGRGLLWAWLLFRWMTFSTIGWDAYELENALSTFPPLLPYILYGAGILIDLSIGVLLLLQKRGSRTTAILWNGLLLLLIGLYRPLTADPNPSSGLEPQLPSCFLAHYFLCGSQPHRLLHQLKRAGTKRYRCLS